MVGVKDLVNPGGRQDDEVLYGSGRNNDSFHDGSTTNPTTSSTSSYPTGSSSNPATTTNPSSTHPHGYGQESGVSGAGHHSAVNPHPFASHGLGVVEPTSTSGTFDDAATTASIKSGVAGKAQGGSLTNPSGSHHTLGSNKPLSEPSAHSGNTHTAGPHSSDLANRVDPRVDSDHDGHKGLDTSTAGTGSGLTGGSLPNRSAQGSGYGREHLDTSDSSHLGRDAAIGAGALGAGTAAHHHHDRERDGTYGNPSDPSNLGRETAIGGGALGSGALGAGTAAHHHNDRDRDGTYGNTPNSSHLGRDAAIGTGALGAGTAGLHHDRQQDGTYSGTTAGPHFSNLANKVDPRVDSDLSGSRYDPKSASGSGPGLSSGHTGAYTGTTTGPHSSNLANKADPRVDSDRDGSALGGNTGYGSGTGHLGGDGPHLTHGPHVTDTANRLDPHVDPSSGKHVKTRHTELEPLPGLVGGETSTRAPGGIVTGSGHHAGPIDSTTAHHQTPGGIVTGSGHHTGPTDSTTAHHQTPGGIVTGSGHHTGPTDSTTTHHQTPGGIVTGSGHHTGPTDSTTAHHHTDPLGTTSGHHHTDSTEPTSHTTGPVHKSALLNKLDPRVKTESPTAHDTIGEQHHKDRTPHHADGAVGIVPTNPADHTGHDLAFTGAGAGAGGFAGLESATALDSHGRNIAPGTTHTTGTGSRDISGPAGVSGAATYEAQEPHDRRDPTGTTHSSTHPTSGYSDPDNKTGHHHTGRDAALGGAAAGTGAEFSKKEAEKLEKQHQAELKKEIKAHEKEEKQHHKALEKEEKKHEKALEKDDKKHHDDGKKHGGILGLFHRDKTTKHDKEIEEEPRHKDKAHRHETEATVGAGAVGAGVADHHKHGDDKPHDDPVSEKHERNRLHKDPPAGYGEVPQGGYASQVTGGTETTALAQGQKVHRGSHLTGLGNDLDPNVPARGSSVGHNEPIEPNTGLPIDLSKGTGVGGIDDSSAPGYRAPGSGLTGGSSGYGAGSTGATTGHSGSGLIDGSTKHHGSGLTGDATGHNGSGLTSGTSGHGGSGLPGGSAGTATGENGRGYPKHETAL